MYDFVLVGGGLQNALIAVALCRRVPDIRLVLIERGPTVGGNHTWCFHDGDVAPSAREFVDPFVVYRWPACTVRFPALHRDLGIGYAAITSERLHEVVTTTLNGADGCRLMCAARAIDVGADRVVLEDGTRLHARAVVDARGPTPVVGDTGYQKFVGQEIVTARPHGVELPVIMDATLPQRDGYRFMYLLPFSDTRLLVEETFFSDTAALPREQLRHSLEVYIRARGWSPCRVVREEHGVLPMPWRGQFHQPINGPFMAGYRGGFFHPATGYSLPVAVRLADHISRQHKRQFFDTDLQIHVARQRQRRQFAYLLNKMLFSWFPGPERRNVFERFYRLPEATIRRFYSLQMTRMDQFRLFWGRPPRGISWRSVVTGGHPR